MKIEVGQLWKHKTSDKVILITNASATEGTYTIIGDPLPLFDALKEFSKIYWTTNEDGKMVRFDDYIQNRADMMLEVSIHFEEGAKKYGDNNWRKGIPAHCYIDSAVRHYLKWIRGDNDEHHDRAFAWNLLCCIWTCQNEPELNNYLKGETKSEKHR